MSLLTVIIVLVAIGIVWYLVNQILPLPEKMKQLINIVIYIAVVLWLMRIFGLIDALSTIRI